MPDEQRGGVKKMSEQHDAHRLPGDLAQELGHAGLFVGVLTERERLRILRHVH